MAAAQDEEKKVAPRFGFAYNAELYPQKKPDEALKSIVKAIDAKRIDYLLAQLADPKFVDAQIAEFKATIKMGDPEQRAFAAFQKLVEVTNDYFQADPALIKELRLFAQGGKFEIEDTLATGTLKGSPRKVFMRQIGERWFLENRQQ
jgi:hypothetical protein